MKKTGKRSNQMWPGSYDNERMQKAVDKTINIIAQDHDKLVGCIRTLSDDYLFGTISEVLVLEEYRKQGISRELVDHTMDISPTSPFFGTQPKAEGFYERLNIEKSLQSFVVSKSKG